MSERHPRGRGRRRARGSSEEEDRQQSRSRSRNKDSYKPGRPVKRGRVDQQKSPHDDQFPPEQLSPQALDFQVEFEEGMPESKAINDFVDFFYEIKQDKGLVLSETDRREIIKKAEKCQKLASIKWTERHEWNEENQKKKIISTGQRYGIDFTNSTYSRLFQLLFKVSWIFAQQFTSEVYDVFLQVYQILTGPKADFTPCEEKIQQNEEIAEEKAEELEKDQHIICEDHPAKMKTDEEDHIPQGCASSIDSQLEQLATEMCDNTSGRFYLLSFQFNVIKSRQPSKKKLGEDSDKRLAYQKLVKSIYKTLQQIQQDVQ